METKIFLAREQFSFKEVNKHLTDGWELHPQLGRTALQDGVVYHLIKYADPAEKHLFLASLEAPKAEVADVESIISVDMNQADSYIKMGYKLMVQPTASSKTIILAKYPATQPVEVA